VPGGRRPIQKKQHPCRGTAGGSAAARGVAALAAPARGRPRHYGAMNSALHWSTAAPPSWARRWRQRLWRVAPVDRAPVVLRHRRIYILPTRRGLALIATLSIMLLTSMNYALSLGHALTFLVTGLFAAALLQTWRNLA